MLYEAPLLDTPEDVEAAIQKALRDRRVLCSGGAEAEAFNQLLVRRGSQSPFSLSDALLERVRDTVVKLSLPRLRGLASEQQVGSLEMLPSGGFEEMGLARSVSRFFPDHQLPWTLLVPFSSGAC